MDPKTKDLIVIQIEKSNEKLRAAKVLLKEGLIDDAISRAYYSMFHAASAVLFSEGITVESHSALKTMFGLHLVKTGKIDKEYGRWLNKLKDERENGDYDIFTSFDFGDAENDIKEAEKFLEQMKNYLSQQHGIQFRPEDKD
ncbi:MAG: HEPN domain-containing protein [Desulfobacterota bacterium]|nr:HEPN domain-containing protein [Thermodesulfobacteriota bacterium]